MKKVFLLLFLVLMNQKHLSTRMADSLITILGVIGTYVGQIYSGLQKRPRFIIRSPVRTL